MGMMPRSFRGVSREREVLVPAGLSWGTAGSAWTDGSCSMEKFSVSKT